MNEPHLKPCPFCGGKAHIRTKTKKRQNTTHNGYYFDYNGYDHECPGYDGRMGAQVYCGRCHVQTRYHYGEWQEFTEDEWEIYADLEHWAERFREHPDKAAIEAAVKDWNRRENG